MGASFGRKIIAVVLKFQVRRGSAMAALRRQWEQPPGVSLKGLTPVEWQSVVMQSGTNGYRELYFDSNPPSNTVRPLRARILTVGHTRLLAVRENYQGWCAEGYWELDRAGPWLLSFLPVKNAIAKVSPRDSRAPQTGCWALSVRKLEVKASVQEDGARCMACGWLGQAVVRFTIADDQVVPVSSEFKPFPPSRIVH